MNFYPTEKNVGGWDRLLRLIVGPALLVVAAVAAGGIVTLSPLLIASSAVVGLILTVTGLTQKCPLNNALGMNTYNDGKTAGSETEGESAKRTL
ncbi:YgaP family membrane protein [Haloarcula nitratireducens]|uniref:DUF2892 domain-containing protein n=1 Tax=Haloarcula nitratireducens TaxID=2487749 RepID=A0AAW4P839_9EURY|nr:DUF2892 domain-containing protein [Halomicroarcula nitratireducens]MBX0293906.1 DUF2892 domain-containing protein [Halomicroarcula nitratireducens]